MASFELVYITKPELDDEANAALLERYSGLIAGQGGTLEGVDKLGKRRLAYEIDGKRDGTYTVIRFQAGPDVPAELDRVLRIADEVIRHLIVRQEIPKPGAAKAKATKPAQEPAGAEAVGQEPAKPAEEATAQPVQSQEQ